MSLTRADRLFAARDAAERHAWQEAYDLLVELDGDEGLDGAGLELLGLMAWWVGRPDVAVRSRERAYTAYNEEGDGARAAFAALLAARDHRDHQAEAVAAGWRARAARILADEAPSFAHGYLAVFESMDAASQGDLVRAGDLAARAVEIGSRFGDKDLQALALVSAGQALIRNGDTAEGLLRLDEATAAAVAGELSPFITGVVYCQTISACRDLADFRRAGQWTEVAKAWCERQSISGFPGVCRVHRAEILALHGDWTGAEDEARRASEELMAFRATAQAADGYYALGEIRLRMGDLVGADEAFRLAQDLGREPQPGRSLHYLAQGNVEAAASSISRTLATGAPDRLARARLLPAQVEIALAAHDLDAARLAAAELREIADDFGSTALKAAAHYAQGTVSIEAGEPDLALADLATARLHWLTVEAPYDLARTRAAGAAALRLRGEVDEATIEADAARSAFTALGADGDAARCAQLLDDLRRHSGREERQRRTFVFTDIVGSTELIGVIGDDAWSDVKRWHDQALRTLASEHGGEEVNEAGDGFFFAFESVRAAVDCAVAIQRALAEHRRSAGFAPRVRIGIHATEATRAGDGYVGQGVHEAARIGALANAGEIVASSASIEDESIAGAGAPRSVALKGIAGTVSIQSIDWAR